MSISKAVNPVGTGQGLNYIGNDVYGYTGLITSLAGASTQYTAMQFNTPNKKYVYSYFNWGYAQPTSTDLTVIININGETILQEVVNNYNADLSPVVWPLILPPQSLIEVKYIFDNGSDELWFAITGKLKEL